jgi:DNA-binding IclR family transcriptional regulator
MHRARLNAYETVPGKSLLAQIPIAESRRSAVQRADFQRNSSEFLRREIEDLRIPKHLNERLRIVGRHVHGPGTEAGSTRDG